MSPTHAATYCNTLQCICNTLPFVYVWLSTSLGSFPLYIKTATNTATHYSTLQYTATPLATYTATYPQHTAFCVCMTKYEFPLFSIIFRACMTYSIQKKYHIKRALYSPEELYISQKSPTSIQKNPFLSKEPYILSKAHHILSKEPYILSEEPYIYSKKAILHQKSPTFYQKRPTFYQTSTILMKTGRYTLYM